jgi:tellurite resistance protein TerC
MYSVVGRLLVTFDFLHYGLSVILGFVGVKMLISEWYTVPVSITLTVVVTVLCTSLLISLLLRKKPEGPNREAD